MSSCWSCRLCKPCKCGSHLTFKSCKVTAAVLAFVSPLFCSATAFRVSTRLQAVLQKFWPSAQMAQFLQSAQQQAAQVSCRESSNGHSVQSIAANGVYQSPAAVLLVNPASRQTLSALPPCSEDGSAVPLQRLAFLADGVHLVSAWGMGSA